MARLSSKVGHIHEALSSRILNGEWKEGERIPTSDKLAQEFDCSIGTVSKALALLSHEGLVLQRTKAGTRVTFNSSTSASRETDRFAFIYPNEEHEGIWRLVRGFQDAAREADRRTVMLTTGTDYRKELDFIRRLSEFDVKGAVVYPVLPTSDDLVQFSKMVLNSRFPLVLVEVNLPGLGCSAVTVDNFHAGYTMTKHLIARGAKRIGYFSNYASAPTMRDRYQGYRWALAEAGLPEAPETVLLESSMHPDFSNPTAEPIELAGKYFREGIRPDAVVCAGDFLAIGLLTVAKTIGIRVPEDLLVTGMDNYKLSHSDGTALTTFEIPNELIGRKAFAALTDRVHNSAKPSEEQVRGNIIIRETA